MGNRVTVRVLVDNVVRSRGLMAEHGYSVWIDTGQHCILFDTGQGMALLHNADALGVDLRTVTDIVLSHGHYDHTGALCDVLGLAGKVRVHAHAGALSDRMHVHADGVATGVGIPASSRSALEHANVEMCLVDKPVRIGESVLLTGPVPRETDFEDTGGRFFVDGELRTPDVIPDDQSLCISTQDGLVVVLGCAHAGVINTLSHLLKLFEDQRIAALIGGMHLGSASRDRLQQTVSRLVDMEVAFVVPGHCTGDKAIQSLRGTFEDRCTPSHVGMVMSFPM